MSRLRRDRESTRVIQEELGFGGLRVVSMTMGVEGITVEGYVTHTDGGIFVDLAEQEPVRWKHTFRYEDDPSPKPSTNGRRTVTVDVVADTSQFRKQLNTIEETLSDLARILRESVSRMAEPA